MLRPMFLIALLVAARGVLAAADPPEASVIASRAAAQIRSDWEAAPGFAFVQRDTSIRSGISESHTWQVLMIGGSDYYMPIAINDQPLAPERQLAELRRLKDEVSRRSKEDTQTRQLRSEQYRKTREQNGAVVLEFPRAFDFQFAGEEEVLGHPAWILSATPRADSGGQTQAGKLLKGMKGKMWVEQNAFHIVRAESAVIAPVSIFGILARILPGTHMKMEMAPVDDTRWLVSNFSMELKISKFFFFNSGSTNRSEYSQYSPNEETLARLLAAAR